MTLNFYLILIRSKDLPERLDIQLTSVLELRQEMLDECHPGKHLTFGVFLIVFILNGLYVNSVHKTNCIEVKYQCLNLPLLIKNMFI